MKSRGQLLLLPLLLAGLAAGEIKNKGWWKNTVFYQIYPRSFMDSDNNGVGDLKGITSKLEHFKESGIGAIWLSPINRSPMIDFGYDISDYRDVDETFGTLEDMEELLKEAKKIGLKVILDLVPNHTSDKHQWFQDSVQSKGRYKDYYIWADGKSATEPPNNWLSVFGGSAWKYDDTRKQYYFHQFEYRQPDLNYNNPDVRQEMEDVITFWMDKGIDGFRIDAVPHLFEYDISKDEPLSGAKVSSDDHAYLNHIYTKDHPDTYVLIQSWRNLVDKYADEHNIDEKVLMTEAYTSLENTIKFYNYGAQIPFNFKFIVDVNAGSSPNDFKRIIDEWMNYKPKEGVANWVIGNHDNSRTATRYYKRGDQMTMLAMILPGVAVTYNGEEIGMVDNQDISYEDTQDPQGKNAGRDGYKTKSRDPCRTPFQWSDEKNAGFSKAEKTWLPIPQNYTTVNLENQKNDAQSSYSIYKTLTSLRQSSDALKNGDLVTSVVETDVLAVVRKATNQTVSLLINFSNTEPRTIDLSQVVDKRSSKILLTNPDAGLKWNEEINIFSFTIPQGAAVVVETDNNKAVSGAMPTVGYPFLILAAICIQLFRS